MSNRIPLKENAYDLVEFVHARNVVCSRALLDALSVYHGVAVDPPVSEPEDVLPPIPDKEIAQAAEMAFPKYINRLSEIRRLVLKEFPGMTMSEMMSRRRKKHLVLARHICMYVAKYHTGKSYPEIGRRFNGMDHSTIISGVNRIERDIQRNAEIAAMVNRVEKSMQIYDDER